MAEPLQMQEWNMLPGHSVPRVVLLITTLGTLTFGIADYGPSYHAILA